MFKRRRLSNSLLKLIEERDWINIYKHIDKASLLDISSNTFALHEVCDDPTVPIKIVQDIYYAYPMAVFAEDNDQHTPLYIAVDARFEDSVKFLANQCSEATFQCGKSLRSAVHILNCTNIIDSIIIACPEAAFIPDHYGASAFDIFFRIWNALTRIAVQTTMVSSIALDREIGQRNWKTRDVYQKACLFLRAANLHKYNEARHDTCLLHCALREESCHWAFCKLFMKLHPEAILKRDSDGNLPIHIIAAARNLSDEESFLCTDCFSTKSKL